MAYTLNYHQLGHLKASSTGTSRIFYLVSQGMIASNATKVKHLRAVATQMALRSTPHARVRRPRRTGAGF